MRKKYNLKKMPFDLSVYCLDHTIHPLFYILVLVKKMCLNGELKLECLLYSSESKLAYCMINFFAWEINIYIKHDASK